MASGESTVNSSDALAKLSGTERAHQRNRFLGFTRTLFKTRLAVPALVILGLVVFASIFAEAIAPYDPITDQFYAVANQGPSGDHWLGTDYIGRDIFSRILFGSRVSLLVGAVSVAIALSAGTIIGVLAGYGRSIFDSVLMRLTEAINAFPPLMLALAITAALGHGIVNAMIAIGVVSIPTFARLARASTFSVQESDYVLAGRAIGATDTRLVARYILPNIAAPLIVQSSLLFGVAIAIEAGLSFLGVGIQPPNPSWGIELRNGYAYMQLNPILAFAPGVAIFVTVLACNFLGDALRTALDPRLSRRG